MRKHVSLGIFVCFAMGIAGYARVSQAGCCGDCGEPCTTCCDPCCPPPCGCDHCHPCVVGEVLRAPFDVAKWALQVIGGGCPCGGCDREVYWGDYCPEPDPCHHCGCCGQMGSSYGPPMEGGIAPQSGMMVDPAPAAPCNCNRGGVSRSNYPAVQQQTTTVVRQSPTRYASYPAPSDRTVASSAAPRMLPASYASEPRYSASQRAISASRTTVQPTYTVQPTPVQAPSYSQSSGYSPDMFRPRLISVTDRVVTPAGGATATAAAPEIER